jgi:hypothetical protein
MKLTKSGLKSPEGAPSFFSSPPNGLLLKKELEMRENSDEFLINTRTLFWVNTYAPLSAPFSGAPRPVGADGARAAVLKMIDQKKETFGKRW